MGNEKLSEQFSLEYDGSANRERIDQINKGLDHLDNESDRGVILIIGAIMDELLAELLRNVLEPAMAEILLRGTAAPLSTFSARAKMAKAIGIIEDQTYKDIEIVRKVRNAAAHFDSKRGFDTGFESQNVVDLCSNLSQNPSVPGMPARMKFIFAAKTASGSILIHVIIAQIVNQLKGHLAALKAVQGKTLDFMYNFEDIDNAS